MDATSGLLHTFLASCPEMLFIAGVDGDVLQSSRALRQALGAGIEHGNSLTALVHEEDRADFAAAWTRLKEQIEPVQVDVRLMDAQGAYRRLTCNASRAPEGGTIHGSLRQVDADRESSRAEPSLKERLLDGLADNLQVAIWAIDTQGTVIYHDGKGLDAAGLARGELLGKNLLELYPEKDRIILRGALAGAMAHDHNTAHGVHWESWVVPVLNRRGEVDSVLGFSLDITTVRRAQDELRARITQIEKQQEVIRNLSTPIIEVWNGVLTLPMIGVVDSVRTAEVMDALLARIMEKQAHFAILDLTGVEVVDTKVASHLIELVAAIRLLGAEGIVAGIKPNVAQTMVALGLDLSTIATQRDLRAALSYCIRRMAPQPPQENRAGVTAS
ncbi:PAS domain-containing protein [Sorangium atrum]|uniref:PAS domain-containing protein n=1 Tax=Sorangium atrum TaxID=2995308 RepID=A0ABT5C7V5_9BACT|nr:PAS domain-containing protein [Sorangium aterium]MDC0681728.1 PAS domain-containing protein [Sorangium aterium]